MPVEATSDRLKAIRALDTLRGSWAAHLNALDLYLRGEQPLRFMTDAVRQEFGEKIAALIINWPELAVEAYENRCDVEGFRFPGEPQGDAELWQVWQANNMDGKSSMGHTDAIGLSRAAVIVGDGESVDAPPLITVESALDVAWRRDPRYGTVLDGIKRWVDADRIEWASYYGPGFRETYLRQNGVWMLDSAAETRLPAPSIVPLVNNPRIKHPEGRSEFESVISIADAANKIATDMMQSAEYHAMPRRWVFGMKASDFKDKAGNLLAPWKALKNHIWANENPNIKAGQFPESDLRNFHETIKLLAQIASHTLALPPDYMAFTSGNPTSADAIRANESRLVKRVERKHVVFGESWEQVMRLVLAQMGRKEVGAQMLETVWRDPATPTIGQKADAAVKLAMATTADGRPIVPLEQTRIDLGYTAAQRSDMKRMDQEAAMDPVTSGLLEGVRRRAGDSGGALPGSGAGRGAGATGSGAGAGTARAPSGAGASAA